MKKVTACILLFLLGLFLSVPAMATDASKSAYSAQQKHATKSWKKDMKRQKRKQAKEQKAQQKAARSWKKQHQTGS